MSIAIYEGNFDDLSGGIVSSWFTSDPRGPTAFAVGFAEVADMKWSLFYRRMHFTGARTYLGGVVDEEMSATSDRFDEVFFNHMIAVNNHLALYGRDAPEFLGEVPSFLRTNGNPHVAAAMRWLIANAAEVRGTDWGQELYLCETYGAALAGPVGRELRQALERRGKQKQRASSEALFTRWWAKVTDKAYVEPSIFQFAQAWVAADRSAKHSGQPSAFSSGNRMSYSALARFFDNLHMPLLPPEVDERFLLQSLGLN